VGLVRSRPVHLVVDHRRRVVAALFALASALGGLVSVHPARATSARASHTASVREHVALKLVRRSGVDRFVHKGRASGTFVGSVSSKITISHSVILRGTVTIATSGGKVRLKIDGRARSLELRTRFNGTATIAGGTGKWAQARGRGTFNGVVNRSTWAATIDATGSVSF
jgi:hypothetical protein